MTRNHVVGLVFWMSSACWFTAALMSGDGHLVRNLGLGMVFLLVGLIWWRGPSDRTRGQGDAVGLPGPGKMTLTLLESGPDNISSIKALRKALPQLSLAEAKRAVDEAHAGRPAALTHGATPEEAKSMRAVLEAAGCKVSVTPSPSP